MITTGEDEQKTCDLYEITHYLIPSTRIGLAMSVHTSHLDIIKRLKRAAGHLKSTIQMLEDERACLDIAQQLHAVEKAITNAKRTLIHDHLDHCLEDIIQTESYEDENTLSEFKEITKYL